MGRNCKDFDPIRVFEAPAAYVKFEQGWIVVVATTLDPRDATYADTYILSTSIATVRTWTHGTTSASR